MLSNNYKEIKTKKTINFFNYFLTDLKKSLLHYNYKGFLKNDFVGFNSRARKTVLSIKHYPNPRTPLI